MPYAAFPVSQWLLWRAARRLQLRGQPRYRTAFPVRPEKGTVGGDPKEPARERQIKVCGSLRISHFPNDADPESS